ncbi:MAG TPA: IS4 family transposase [Saprospiraceae bacterium]|nr:IS4 family transposase [Saprospiraceae bacterium]
MSNVLKQCFEKIIPSQDARTAINPLSFVVCLVFCYLGDSNTFSLEAIRRCMKSQLNTDISRSAFWERLARDRLKEYLGPVVAELMVTLTSSVLRGNQLLKSLDVLAIWRVDASSITLRTRAKPPFPGTRTAAGINWHARFDLLTGMLTWFQITATKIHERNCFPALELLKGKLVIFDLGYWDYSLLYAIEKAGGFFLSRLKSNAVIYIAEVVQGLSKQLIGQALLSLDLSHKKGNIIAVFTTKMYAGKGVRYRVIGLWNAVEKEYHWYMTNLLAAAYLIYPLYRLRWQIELIFKACKNSLNANQITSGDENIIHSLLLASIAAQLSTHSLFQLGLEQVEEDQQVAMSFQRIAKIAVVLAGDFIKFLLNSSREHFDNLVYKIKLFANEMFDPNYKKRETSLMRINRLLLESEI